jgi:hypothetical protein
MLRMLFQAGTGLGTLTPTCSNKQRLLLLVHQNMMLGAHDAEQCKWYHWFQT